MGINLVALPMVYVALEVIKADNCPDQEAAVLKSVARKVLIKYLTTDPDLRSRADLSELG